MESWEKIEGLTASDDKTLYILDLLEHAQHVVRQTAAAVETDEDRLFSTQPRLDLLARRVGRLDEGCDVGDALGEFGGEALAAGELRGRSIDGEKCEGRLEGGNGAREVLLRGTVGHQEIVRSIRAHATHSLTSANVL